MNNPSSEEITELCADADEATWSVGYMRAIINEPLVGEKLDNSFSGYAMQIATAAVKRSLVLYCARAWDPASDVISILSVAKELANPDGQSDILRARWLEDSRNLKECEIARSIRIFRTEWLAHRVPSSKERQSFKGEVERISLSQLVGFAEKTILLVGDLGFILKGEKNSYCGRLETAERYCREFWRLLPVLKDVEAFP